MERCRCAIGTGASLLVGVSLAIGVPTAAYAGGNNDCGSFDNAEVEVCLEDEAVDANGGCNLARPIFTDAFPGTWGGQVSTYDVNGGDVRDTDWYLLSPETLAAADRDGNGILQIQSTVISEPPTATFIVSIGNACDNAVVVGQTGWSDEGCGGGGSSLYTVFLDDHPDGIVAWVGTADSGGGVINDGYECATGLNDYVLEIELMDTFTECGPGAGACNQANGTGGCDDVGCCQLVCDVDPACCIIEWDNFCVGIAEGIGCLPEPIIRSLDGLWTADIDEFGQILNFFPAAQPDDDNVWESVIYEANSETNNMLSRRVGPGNYTIVSNTTISQDGTTAVTVLEADDVDLTMEIEHTMLDGVSGGAHTTIRCENTGVVPISCKIFYYCDFDVGGDFADDEAVTIPDPPDPLFVIEQVDSAGTDGVLWFGACPDYEEWQLATWPELLNDLNGGVAALTNEDTTPPPGGGGDFDHTAAVSGPMTLLQPGEIVELQAGVGGVDFDACGAPPDCPWDLDGDNSVGTGDLILLLGSWGDPYGTADLIELLGNWGPCP